MNHKILIAAFFLILFTSCVSTQYFKQAELYNKQGEFPQAAELVLLSLEANPKNKDSQLLLEHVFPQAERMLLDRAQASVSSGNTFAWTEAADAYIFLHKLNRMYEALPPLYHKKQNRIIQVKITYYPQELENAKDKAAEEQYQEGRRLAGEDSKEELRKAISFFEKAQYYRNNYKDSKSQIEALMNSASDKVLILPQNEDFQGDLLWNLDESFYHDLLSAIIQGAKSKRYMKVVDRDNLDTILEEQKMVLSGITSSDNLMKIGELSNADTLITYSITSLIYQKPNESHRTEERSLDFPLPEDHPDYDLYPEHIKPVSGSVDTIKMETSVELKGVFQIIDISSSQLIDTLSLTATSEDRLFRVEYTGDPEILTENEKEILESWNRDIRTYESLVLEAEETLAAEMAEEILKSFQ